MDTTTDDLLDNPASPSTFELLFESENLQVPPVPAELASAMRQEGDTIFATMPLQASPYDIGHFLAEIEHDPGLPSYAIVGFDGHGINSWAAHYYVVHDALALFVQLPWGGAYLDAEAARLDIADLFSWAEQLQSKVLLASQQQKIPKGLRLQVAASKFKHAGWRWLAADGASQPWNSSEGMKASLQQLLDDILSGKRGPLA